MDNPIRFENSLRNDADGEVRSLFQSAKKRKEDEIRFRLLGELLQGEVIDVTKSDKLFEALNRENMEFEQLLKLHPDEVKETIDYVKQRREEQNGKWYNPDSQAWWGEKGAIPPCCYFARPSKYWKNKKLVNHFFNTFSKFRIAENPL